MMATATQAAAAASVWWRRARYVLATALLWAGLHYVVGGVALPRGVDRPLVLSPLSGLLLIGVLWAGALVLTVLVRLHDLRRLLIVIGLALALWAAEGGRRGGTMDDWLIQRNLLPGAPTSAPYWSLLGDYAYLLVGVAGVCVIFRKIGWRDGAGTASKGLRPAFGLTAPPDQRRVGLLALLLTTVVSGVAVFILTGPPLGETYRGQVYFAVALGSFAGVFVAHRTMKVADPLWYGPAPLLLGIIGLVVAAFKPGLMLPPDCHLNSIPAWGLSRALPIEMVGVGLVGTLWTLRPPVADAARDGGG
jgi:hypothetical protein